MVDIQLSFSASSCIDDQIKNKGERNEEKNFILIIKYTLKIGYLKNQTRYSKHKMKG